jgi:hypothetical protein
MHRSALWTVNAVTAVHITSGWDAVNTRYLFFLSFRFCFIQRQSIRCALMRKAKLNCLHELLWKRKEGVSLPDNCAEIRIRSSVTLDQVM